MPNKQTRKTIPENNVTNSYFREHQNFKFKSPKKKKEEEKEKKKEKN